MTYPSLNPSSSFGSGSRTGASIVISSPRTRIGSLKRVINFEKNHQNRTDIFCFLIKVLNPNAKTPCDK
jgi:hypothetical protein